MNRLTDEQRRLRLISEAEWQDQVVAVAVLYGWEWMHVRKAGRASGPGGWRTPTAGTLARGWPDLILTRSGRRPVAAELKRETGTMTPEQGAVLAVLSVSGFDVALWRPRHLDEVSRFLGGNTGQPGGDALV